MWSLLKMINYIHISTTDHLSIHISYRNILAAILSMDIILTEPFKYWVVFQSDRHDRRTSVNMAFNFGGAAAANPAASKSCSRVNKIKSIVRFGYSS